MSTQVKNVMMSPRRSAQLGDHPFEGHPGQAEDPEVQHGAWKALSAGKAVFSA
jgi:hypothetical protein